jgi:mono/diheme cytochrome c family protein
MRRLLKWVAITLGATVALLTAAAVVLSLVGTSRLHRSVPVEVENVPVSTDSASLARGQHLVHFACEGCHGSQLTGQLLVPGGIGRIHSANITGLSATHTDVDLVRAIRHAVAPDGHALAIMPAYAFVYFSREDLGAAIAYLKTLPRAGSASPKPELSFLGRILLATGKLKGFFPAEEVDHQIPFPVMPEIGANLATGEYLSRFCRGCHGLNLRGGHPPDPEAPTAPNLAVTRSWAEADFFALFQTGRTPDGRALNPDFMPWRDIAKLTPEELRALYLYLQTLPPQ